MKRSIKRIARRRAGSVIVLMTLMMVAMMALLALAVDIGYLQAAKTQLQQSADASALAATEELVDDEALTGPANLTDEIASARAVAVQYAASNKVCTVGPVVDSNTGNSQSGDVVVGYLSNPSDPACSMTFANPDHYNAVKVTVRKTSAENGQVPFFFARVLGMNGIDTQMSATAALINNFSGFRAPKDGSNLEMLPFALDLDTWNNLNSNGTDNWSYSASGQVSHAPDGIREVNLYPQGTGAPGNRGTVDLGSSNNSTADISRQILQGINSSDLGYLGGQIKFNADGKLYLNGDTGISAGVKDELASIKGRPKIIPIFESVSGPGNNAQYTIVALAGVRIVDVDLTGSPSNKRVIIQPANIKVAGGIANTGPQSSYYMHSAVWLVR